MCFSLHMNSRALQAKTKYQVKSRLRYKYLADADKKNTFDVDRFLTATRRKRQQVVTQDEIFDLYEIDLSDEDAAAE